MYNTDSFVPLTLPMFFEFVNWRGTYLCLNKITYVNKEIMVREVHDQNRA
jgi:hypothetical protein